MRNKLGIDWNVQLGNVQIPEVLWRKNRPIVARFLSNSDRQTVKERGYMLRGKPFGINEQLPEAMDERRKGLESIMKHFKRQGLEYKLVGDNLDVKGQPYEDNRKTSTEHSQCSVNEAVRMTPGNNCNKRNHDSSTSNGSKTGNAPSPSRPPPTSMRRFVDTDNASEQEQQDPPPQHPQSVPSGQ